MGIVRKFLKRLEKMEKAGMSEELRRWKFGIPGIISCAYGYLMRIGLKKKNKEE